MDAIDSGDAGSNFTSIRWRLLTGVSCAALAVTCLLPQRAEAHDYIAFDDASLRQAITDANSDPDPSATITLEDDIAMASTANFPTATGPIMIVTNVRQSSR